MDVCGWLGRYRRLTREYEHTTESREAVSRIGGNRHSLPSVVPQAREPSERFQFKGHRPKQGAYYLLLEQTFAPMPTDPAIVSFPFEVDSGSA